MQDRLEIQLTPEGGTYSVGDMECERPSVAIATAMEAHADDHISPLYESVDADAIDTLFHEPTKTDDLQGYLAFTCNGFRITVEADGTVRLVTDRPAEGRRQNDESCPGE